MGLNMIQALIFLEKLQCKCKERHYIFCGFIYLVNGQDVNSDTKSSTPHIDNAYLKEHFHFFTFWVPFVCVDNNNNVQSIPIALRTFITYSLARGFNFIISSLSLGP